MDDGTPGAVTQRAIITRWRSPPLSHRSGGGSMTEEQKGGGGSRCRGGNAQGLSKGMGCWYIIGPQGVGVPDGKKASGRVYGRRRRAGRQASNKKAGGRTVWRPRGCSRGSQ